MTTENLCGWCPFLRNCPHKCRYQGGRVKEVAISGESAKKPVKTLNIKETT